DPATSGLTTTGGVPQAPSASVLRAQTIYSFDEQGRAYQSQVFSVNQSTGAVSSSALTTNTWRDHRGQEIETKNPGGLVTKESYDGAGRVTVQYLTDGAGGSSWAQAGTPNGDDVLEQTQYSYDADGNVILTLTR